MLKKMTYLNINVTLICFYIITSDQLIELQCAGGHVRGHDNS